jgi:hypothetical protein
MVGQEMALVRDAVKYHTVLLLTSWTTDLNVTHTDSDLRDPHRA